jgi:hypothetical protein
MRQPNIGCAAYLTSCLISSCMRILRLGTFSFMERSKGTLPGKSGTVQVIKITAKSLF